MRNLHFKTLPDNGEQILTDGKTELFCPFKNSFPTQTTFGGIQIISQPCSSTCPHFNLTDKQGEFRLKLSCGNATEIAVTPEPKPEKAVKGLVIQK